MNTVHLTAIIIVLSISSITTLTYFNIVQPLPALLSIFLLTLILPITNVLAANLDRLTDRLTIKSSRRLKNEFIVVEFNTANWNNSWANTNDDPWGQN